MGNPSSLDASIDRLYQLPLDEFTAARAALARGAAKADAAAVKQLQKPNVIAWALNQLYWSARPAFDRMASAAAQLRSAQTDVLMGRKADLRAADSEHRRVLQETLAEAAAILERSGHAVTPDTLRTINAALEALPWKGPPGRLARPPAWTGFEALAGLPVAAPADRLEAPPAREEAQPAARGGPPAERQADRQPAPAVHRLEKGGAREEKARAKETRERIAAARKALAAATAASRASAERLKRLREAERAARRQLDQAMDAVRAAEAEHEEAVRAERAAQQQLK